MDCRMTLGLDSAVALLQRGDEVLIKAGYGFPRADHDRTEIVVAIQGMAAMTDQATLLPCINKPVFIRTGKHLDRVEISEAVRLRLRAGGWPIEE